MKNLICLKYDIYVDKIYSNNNKHFFFINDEKIYIIVNNENDIDKINNLIILTNSLFEKVKVNTFIINKDNEYVTHYNNKIITLLKVNNIENDFILKDIYKFWNINSNLNQYNIIEDWKEEVDSLEKKVIELNKEYKIVQNSINYYIGMAENAIELLSEHKDYIYNHNDSIGHKMSYKLFDDNDLYNPFIFIKTNKMYDISNYIKYKFIKNKVDYNEIELFFLNSSEYENIFLFCNLLYPSIYFDLLKKVLLEEKKEVELSFIIKKRKKYIKLLSFCKKRVKNNKNIKLINWFN